MPTRQVNAGGVAIGGGAPVTVQTMTNTPAGDFAAALSQTRRLAAAGADIVRLAVPDEAAAGVFAYLREGGVRIPLVADIHFDYRLALAAIRGGAHIVNCAENLMSCDALSGQSALKTCVRGFVRRIAGDQVELTQRCVRPEFLQIRKNRNYPGSFALFDAQPELLYRTLLNVHPIGYLRRVAFLHDKGYDAAACSQVADLVLSAVLAEISEQKSVSTETVVGAGAYPYFFC